MLTKKCGVSYQYIICIINWFCDVTIHKVNLKLINTVIMIHFVIFNESKVVDSDKFILFDV